MLAEMSFEQLLSWVAFSREEPFGELREDLRFGTIAALTANVNRDSKKRPRPYEPSDFFPALKGPQHARSKSGARQPMTAENWKQARKSFVTHFGGK